LRQYGRIEYAALGLNGVEDTEKKVRRMELCSEVREVGDDKQFIPCPTEGNVEEARARFSERRRSQEGPETMRAAFCKVENDQRPLVSLKAMYRSNRDTFNSLLGEELL
jgi:hypothetical protein